jgi:hypothetical protein
VSDTTHVDVLLSIRGQLYHVGHEDIAKSTDWSRVTGQLATLLHAIAWELESGGMEDPPLTDAGVEDYGDNRNTPSPRKVTTPQGLVYWEVAPGEFVYGGTWESAIARYNQKGLSTSEQGLRGLYPGARWENL